MLMLCWFYCIPFAEFMYFATAPVIFVVSLFMLKRGILQARTKLRQWSFILMFLSVGKMCLFDVRMLKDDLLCVGTEDGCTSGELMMADFAGLGTMLFFSFILFRLYLRYMPARKQALKTPHEAGAALWANVALLSIIVMTVWQLAPWVGYLTVGTVPEFFALLPWQSLAGLSLALLLNGFWRAESCAWDYDVTGKGRAYMNKTWTAKDTLWTSVFIYLITLALSYVAHDVLSAK